MLRDDGFTCMSKLQAEASIVFDNWLVFMVSFWISDIADLQRTPQKVYTEIRSVEKSGVSETTVVIAAVAIIALLNILGVFVIVSRKGKKYPV